MSIQDGMVLLGKKVDESNEVILGLQRDILVETANPSDKIPVLSESSELKDEKLSGFLSIALVGVVLILLLKGKLWLK